MTTKYNYCSNCGEYGHRMTFCPTIICRMCKGQGHITVNCPKRGQCLLCGGIDHEQRNCLEKECKICGRKGHKAINCGEYNLLAIKNTDWTKEEYRINRQYRCGCSRREIEEMREHYVKTHAGRPYDTHCCECKRPYPMKNLKKGIKKPYLCTFNCVNFDQNQREIQETTLNNMEIDQQEEENESQKIFTGIDSEGNRYVPMSFTDKNGRIRSTIDKDWDERIPRCVNCQRPAYRSHFSVKAKCMYYYENGKKDSIICRRCIEEFNYTDEDQFYFLEGVYKCKMHNGCLLFMSKQAKKRYNDDPDAQEEFELYKEENTWEEKPISIRPQGEWFNEDDIFNTLVNQNKEFAPDSFEFVNNPIIDQANKSFYSNAEEQKESITDLSLEMNIDEIFNYEKLDQEIEEIIKNTEETIELTNKGKYHEMEFLKTTEEINQLYLQLEETILIRDGWKRQHEVMSAQNEFHKQEIIKQNKTIKEMEKVIGDLQQEKLQQSTSLVEEFNELSKQYQQTEKEQLELGQLFEKENEEQRQVIEDLKEKLIELQEKSKETSEMKIKLEEILEENDKIKRENVRLRDKVQQLRDENERLRRRKQKKLKLSQFIAKRRKN
jgi:hypothetical protein